MGASSNKCTHIRELLRNYEMISRQQVNFGKSSIFFSKNTPRRLRSRLAAIMNISHMDGMDKYLGLPSHIQKSKVQTFNEIRDKVASKLKGWKEKFLSQAGKEVLIKAVATAVPIYSMACFKLRNNLCKAINSMIAKFWWGQKDEERKIHWVTWSSLCKSKEYGDMGF